MFSKEKIYNDFVINLKRKICLNNKKVIFLCIGTNNVIGDCFGPLVGSKLKVIMKKNNNINIIGDMKYPINGKNIYNVFKFINHMYEKSFVVSVDSAMSEFNMIGNVFISETGIELASGINKKILKIGDIGIKACIAMKGINEKENINILKKVPKDLVEDLSQIVSLGIKEVYN